MLGVTTHGLLYPLDDEDLPVGTSRGVSNEVRSVPASVHVRAGVLVAVSAGGAGHAPRPGRGAGHRRGWKRQARTRPPGRVPIGRGGTSRPRRCARAQQVGVAVVAGVLGDHEHEDPPQRHGVAGQGVGAGGVERPGGGHDPPGGVALGPPGGESGERVAVEAVEVHVGVVVGVVEEVEVLPGELDAEPPPLDPGEVAGQAVEGQARGRHGPLGEPVERDALALQLEGAPVVVEVGGQDLALVADQRRVGPLAAEPGREVLRGDRRHGGDVARSARRGCPRPAASATLGRWT